MFSAYGAARVVATSGIEAAEHRAEIVGVLPVHARAAHLPERNSPRDQHEERVGVEARGPVHDHQTEDAEAQAALQTVAGSVQHRPAPAPATAARIEAEPSPAGQPQTTKASAGRAATSLPQTKPRAAFALPHFTWTCVSVFGGKRCDCGLCENSPRSQTRRSALEMTRWVLPPEPSRRRGSRCARWISPQQVLDRDTQHDGTQLEVLWSKLKKTHSAGPTANNTHLSTATCEAARGAASCFGTHTNLKEQQ